MDSLRRFVFSNHDIRGEFVSLEQSFTQLIEGKGYPSTVCNLLGEFLTASVLLSTTLKFKGRLVLQARSAGSVPLIMAECNNKQEVRGIARFDTEVSSSSFSSMVGNGTLAITIEPEQGEPYQGIVPLEGRNLAECLESYFSQSEQLKSRFYLHVEKFRCVGLMLQQLPRQMEKDLDSYLEAWSTVSQLASTVTRQELISLDLDVLLKRLFNQFSIRLFDSESVQFNCSCSRERTAKALNLLGAKEIMSVLREQGKVEVTCEFCGTSYVYVESELKLLFESAVDNQVH